MDKRLNKLGLSWAKLISLVGSLAVLFSNGLKLLFVDQMKLNKWSWTKQDVPVQLIRLIQIKLIQIKLIKSRWKQLSLVEQIGQIK